MTYLAIGLFGPEIRCVPGETKFPVNCQRHAEHYWCSTCQGFYGVPHDGTMHTGPSAHPNQRAGWRDCACRMCVTKRAEIAQRSR